MKTAHLRILASCFLACFVLAASVPATQSVRGSSQGVVGDNLVYLPLIQKPAEPVPHPLSGRWLDPDTTGTVTTIEWQSTGYAVISVINPYRGGNELTWSTWLNGVLRWEYCVYNGANGYPCITSESISTETLIANWYWTHGGNSGTTYYIHLP
jgi:hypothetical protein